jgi:hypothetical protein
VRAAESIAAVVGVGSVLAEPVLVRDLVTAALSHLEAQPTEGVRVRELLAVHRLASLGTLVLSRESLLGPFHLGDETIEGLRYTREFLAEDGLAGETLQGG